MSPDRIAQPNPASAGIARWAAATTGAVAIHAALVGGVLIWESGFEPPKPPNAMTVDVVLEAAFAGAENHAAEPLPSDEPPASSQDTPLGRAEPSEPEAVRPVSTPEAPEAVPVERAVFAPRPKPKPVLNPPPVRKTAPRQPDRARGRPAPPQSARLPGADTAAPARPNQGGAGNAPAGAAAPALVPPRFAQAGNGNPAPDYPRAARRRGLEGKLVLRVVVDRRGRPARIAVLDSSGHALLDDAAREAVARWRFDPGRRGGIPIVAAVDVPVVFRLDNGR